MASPDDDNTQIFHGLFEQATQSCGSRILNVILITFPSPRAADGALCDHHAKHDSRLVKDPKSSIITSEWCAATSCFGRAFPFNICADRFLPERDYEMIPFKLKTSKPKTWLLLLASAGVIAFSTDSASADKMRPGYKSYTRAGLNANTTCRRPFFNICQGCHVTIPMRVVQDERCGINLGALGPFAGQEVISPPHYGSYSIINETTAVYRPNAGYLGPDRFESRLFFQDGTGKRTFLNLTVNVRVLPHL